MPLSYGQPPSVRLDEHLVPGVSCFLVDVNITLTDEVAEANLVTLARYRYCQVEILNAQAVVEEARQEVQIGAYGRGCLKQAWRKRSGTAP